MLISKWPPGNHIEFCGFRTLTLVWLWISTPYSVAKYLCIWVRAYWFSVTSFSKWLPGGHIVVFFCFWMAWFRQRNSSLLGISVSNFMFTSFVAVGRSLTIVSYVAFKMAALWFWTMFNCNPPIAHCHPLLWGGGILADHWSTISSLIWALGLYRYGFLVSLYKGETVVRSSYLYNGNPYTGKMESLYGNAPSPLFTKIHILTQTLNSSHLSMRRQWSGLYPQIRTSYERECGAVITRSIFSQKFTKDTP